MERQRLSNPDLEVLALEAVGGPEEGLTVAELHGAAVGIGVAGSDHFELQDLVDLLGAEALSDGETLARFVNEAVAELYAPDLTFAPLLPDDEVPMGARLEALASWCQSFLAGLVAGLARRGIETLSVLPEEVQEIVQDFAAIAQLDTELAADSDGDEGNFMELSEYAKVGALLIMSLVEDAGDDSES